MQMLMFCINNLDAQNRVNVLYISKMWPVTAEKWLRRSWKHSS